MTIATETPSLQASSGYGPPGAPPGGYGGYGGAPAGGPPPGGYGAPPGGFGSPPGPYPGGPPGGPRVHALAYVSLAAGILSIPACCCWFFGFPLPVIAIACGIIALGKIKNNPLVYSGRLLCLGGIACGSFGLLMTLGFRFTNYGELFKHRYGKHF